ncbi:molybdopterin-dependent oxidoreductase [Tumebacillus sp. ITR2]|uniref:Molybdopterin-dependent oxidoreductase n=1 Tax=Tumebacillus amylolyticus TaxID=2801339 RepID=A0ABS1JAC8_9BACL|nr:molybdopterin-dependent oxidoreductase [Tumebacillus amylolyticus]MBL0387218.1 molybdopterin-dependent oxidoreductase [Tumebacillus amylolyticus]
MTRRRFLKALGLGMAGLSLSGYMVYVFGGTSVSDVWKMAVGSKGSDGFRALENFRINSVEPTPEVKIGDYRLQVDGLVANPVMWAFDQMKQALQEVEQTSNFHCVEGWGIKNVRWTGVKLRELIQRVQPLPTATHVTFYSLGGVYTESLTLAEAQEDETLLAYQIYGQDLPPQQGYPLRVIIPRMFGYKGAKWVYRIEFTDRQHMGYWEKYGYNVDGVTVR